MATHDAACHCGQLRLEVAGDPFAVSICNCLACQRRTGSAFGMQAGFKADQVQVVGRFSDYARISDEADRKEHVFHFCPDCGSQVFYTEPSEPDLVVVSVGSFADPSFPPPTESGYDSRRHHWVGLPDSIQRHAPELWASVRPLYAAGSYAAAADRGRELIEAHPRPGVPLLQRGVLRESCGPDSGRHRAPPPGDRHVGGLLRHGDSGLRLRRDPRQARFPGAARPLGTRRFLSE
jgi:hypothetical protein